MGHVRWQARDDDAVLLGQCQRLESLMRAVTIKHQLCLAGGFQTKFCAFLVYVWSQHIAHPCFKHGRYYPSIVCECYFPCWWCSSFQGSVFPLVLEYDHGIQDVPCSTSTAHNRDVALYPHLILPRHFLHSLVTLSWRVRCPEAFQFYRS